MARKINIFSYSDFRKLLKDLFQYKKEKNKKYSLRMFSAKAGFSSSATLKLVMDGKRNLSTESIHKTAQAFGLSKKETEFFENLVYMNQSDDCETKNYYFKKLTSFTGFVKVRKLDKEHFEYCSEWYHAAIRELIVMNGGKMTAEEISDMLVPPVTPAKVRKSISLLERLGLIGKDKWGKWIQCARAIATDDEVASLLLVNYHKKVIDLAKESISRFPGDRREISSLTLGISEEMLKKIKKKIVQFEDRILEMACAEKNPEKVVQVNFQLFPLSKPPKGDR